MGSWALLLLVHALLSQLAGAKRFDHSMVDPLMRRSPLDKNFMRFGRSSPAFSELDKGPVSSSESEKKKEDDYLRSIRAQESSFIRFGRGKNDNFMRFGRGKQDNFMRFGRGKQDNFMRFGRGNQYDSSQFERGKNNFIRFGRGKGDNFMRFGRGKDNNYMRFGRGKEDNFMRFGRGKEDNFMRFGRGKQDNFMRFGRGKQDNFMRFGRGKQDNFMRFGRGKEDNFMRFGKGYVYLTPPFRGPVQLEDNPMLGDTKGNSVRSKVDSLDSSKFIIPIAMRSPGVEDKFERLLRTRQDNFMRFGKSFDENPRSIINNLEEHNKISLPSTNTSPLGDSFIRELQSKSDSNLVPLVKRPSNKDDSYMKFEKTSMDPLSTELIPQRLKRSVTETYRVPEEVFSVESTEDNDDSSMTSFLAAKDFPDEDFYTYYQPDEYNSKKKKSVVLNEPRTELLPNAMPFPDHVSIEYLLECPYDFTKLAFPFGKDYYSSDINISQLFPKCCFDCSKRALPASRIVRDVENRALPFRETEPESNSLIINNRNKRSVYLKQTASAPSTGKKPHLDNVSIKFLLGTVPKPELQSSLITARLTNAIVAPELSLLPDLNPPSSMLKKNRPSDQNFLRLG